MFNEDVATVKVLSYGTLKATSEQPIVSCPAGVKQGKRRAAKKTITYKILHESFGHASHDCLKHCSKVIEGFPESWQRLIDENASYVCDVCMRTMTIGQAPTGHFNLDDDGLIFLDVWSTKVPHIPSHTQCRTGDLSPTQATQT